MLDNDLHQVHFFKCESLIVFLMGRPFSLIVPLMASASTWLVSWIPSWLWALVLQSMSTLTQVSSRIPLGHWWWYPYLRWLQDLRMANLEGSLKVSRHNKRTNNWIMTKSETLIHIIKVNVTLKKEQDQISVTSTNYILCIFEMQYCVHVLL